MGGGYFAYPPETEGRRRDKGIIDKLGKPHNKKSKKGRRQWLGMIEMQ